MQILEKKNKKLSYYLYCAFNYYTRHIYSCLYIFFAKIFKTINEIHQKDGILICSGNFLYTYICIHYTYYK